MVYPEPLQTHSVNCQTAAASVNLAKDAKSVLAAAINELSEIGRLVLSLHYYEELSLDEVAAVLDLERPDVECLHAAALTQLYASGGMSKAA